MAQASQESKLLWRELRDLFDEDDGSLPELRLIDVSPDGAGLIFRTLLARADPLGPQETIWHDERDEEVPLIDVPDAGELAAGGRIGTLHVLLRGIRSAGIRLPDLGVGIWPGEVAFDYRQGREWNAAVLAAFVDLLAELQQLEPKSWIGTADELDLWPDPVQARFRRAIEAYLDAGK